MASWRPTSLRDRLAWTIQQTWRVETNRLSRKLGSDLERCHRGIRRLRHSKCVLLHGEHWTSCDRVCHTSKRRSSNRWSCELWRPLSPLEMPGGRPDTGMATGPEHSFV